MSARPVNHHSCGACVSRRSALLGAVAVAGTALAVAGCSADADTDATSDPDIDSAGSTAGSTGAAGTSVASLADVPVGGGIVVAAAGVVLTQPVAGTVLAFSSTCTHAGCAVTEVSDGAVRCPCHGSAFSVADGSVLEGPASAPLPARAVTVTGDDITLA